jgi:peptidoglycan/xylan/chitin deacetylase (PgdA/CDA1 family)
MNYFCHLIRSKGLLNLLKRPFMICRRFGLTHTKSVAAIDRVIQITRKHGCEPSFFITADLLDRHSQLIQRIANSGVHIGLHGHHHVDYGCLSLETQTTEIATGLRKFREHKVEPTGFRGPFLRFNDKTAEAVGENNIPWVSHSVVFLDHNPAVSGFKLDFSLQPLLRDFYRQLPHDQIPCLPFWDDCCLEIPVSLPDDEMLVDRLGISDSDRLATIWATMLAVTHKQGEFLNLLFHPERIDYIAGPLNRVLETAVGKGDVWIASLEDIARWWHERAAFTAQIDEGGPDTYRVRVNCTARSSIALQHPGGKTEFIAVGNDRSFPLRTNLKPAICVTAGLSQQTVRGLLNEGFILEEGGDPSRYAFALNRNASGSARDLLDTIIRKAKGPLLRFWRWPRRLRSALALSMDLDAMTFADFLRRAYYFSKGS